MDILESRQPSILFLDNLNFLNTNIEDEERKKFVDKIFKSNIFISTVTTFVLHFQG